MKGSSLLQFLTLILCVGMITQLYKQEKHIESLCEENQALWERLDSLHGVPARGPAPERSAPAKTVIKKRSSSKIFVESSYRIEDRYVTHEVAKPDIMPQEPGVVVIDMQVDGYGKVTKTQVNPASTITDEPVIDACRKAVLQTDFNFVLGHDVNKLQKGKITYTFQRD